MACFTYKPVKTRKRDLFLAGCVKKEPFEPGLVRALKRLILSLGKYHEPESR